MAIHLWWTHFQLLHFSQPGRREERKLCEREYKLLSRSRNSLGWVCEVFEAVGSVGAQSMPHYEEITFFCTSCVNILGCFCRFSVFGSHRVRAVRSLPTSEIFLPFIAFFERIRKSNKSRVKFQHFQYVIHEVLVNAFERQSFHVATTLLSLVKVPFCFNDSLAVLLHCIDSFT